MSRLEKNEKFKVEDTNPYLYPRTNANDTIIIALNYK